jgi:hypothetical protein
MLIITFTKYLTFVVILFVLTSTVSYAHEEPAVTFLTIWSTARSAALGGAMTGLADDADAAFWNPGGLGFQKGWGFTGTFNKYLPGIAPVGVNFYYLYGSVGYSFPDLLRNKMILNIGINNTYLSTGKTEIINERGEYLGEITTYVYAVGIHSGIRLSDKFGLGLGIKYIKSHLIPDRMWFWYDDIPGIDNGGSGSSLAIDMGVLYRPFNFLSAGFTLANIGPRISYIHTGASDPLPRMFRIGLCYTPVDNNYIRLRILPEINKMLVGMLYDPIDTLSLGQELSYEWKEAWKSFGVEATIKKILSLRLGYFEAIMDKMGGVRVIRNNHVEYLSLFEYLFSRDRGRLDKIGLTFGFGIGFKDYLRFDLSSDHLIWDFSTSNLKFSLTSNDPIGLAREIFLIF